MVLVYVAHGRALFKRESLDNFAEALGVETITHSAVSRSLERLRKHELVERRQERGEYRVSDEPLATQLRELSPRLSIEAQEEALQLPPAR